MHLHTDLWGQTQVCTLALGIWDELRHLAYCIGNFIVYPFADSLDAAYFLANEKAEKHKEVKCKGNRSLSSLLTVMNNISRHVDLEVCHRLSLYLGLQSKAGTRSKNSQEYIPTHLLALYIQYHPITFISLCDMNFLPIKFLKLRYKNSSSEPRVLNDMFNVIHFCHNFTFSNQLSSA